MAKLWPKRVMIIRAQGALSNRIYLRTGLVRSALLTVMSKSDIPNHGYHVDLFEFRSWNGENTHLKRVNEQ